MDAATGVILVVIALIALGYVSRFRGSSAMGSNWTIETPIDDSQLEQLIRQHLRGYLPLGRVRGSLAEGHLTRRIRRHAVSLNSEATVAIRISDRRVGPSGSNRTVDASIEDCEIETVAGMAHPAWSAPLAARRRLNALIRALQGPASA